MVSDATVPDGGGPRPGRVARPTMKDVAARAGVDTSTVSRALNEATREMLSVDTVERVLAAAAELRYRPNVLARGLRTQNSRIIGMLVPDLMNPFFPPIVRGLEEELGEQGYTLIVINTDNDADRERNALTSLLDRQVDGLLVATSRIATGPATSDHLGAVPTVLVNRRSDRLALPSVVPLDAVGVGEVVGHLAELGHRHVAHVAGPQHLSTGRGRRQAFQVLSEDAGLAAPVVEVADAFVQEAGRIACQRLLDAAVRFTALFAANDLLAIGALRALRAAGRSVPGDVSLVGYNDMPLVEMIEPPLTTVRVPQYEMGREAAKLLLAQLAGEDVSGACVELPTHLVVRESTAAPA